MKELVLIRLVSGEEIIGDITDNGDSVTVKDAVNLVSTGEGRMAFIPFMAYCETSSGIKIDNKFVLFQARLNKEMESGAREFIQSFKSKIELPKKQSIVTEIK